MYEWDSDVYLLHLIPWLLHRARIVFHRSLPNSTVKSRLVNPVDNPTPKLAYPASFFLSSLATPVKVERLADSNFRASGSGASTTPFPFPSSIMGTKAGVFLITLILFSAAAARISLCNLLSLASSNSSVITDLLLLGSCRDPCKLIRSAICRSSSSSSSLFPIRRRPAPPAEAKEEEWKGKKKWN